MASWKPSQRGRREERLPWRPDQEEEEMDVRHRSHTCQASRSGEERALPDRQQNGRENKAEPGHRRPRGYQ